MTWTRDTPTVPGFYWWREPGKEKAVMARTRLLGGKLVCLPEGSIAALASDLGGAWQGPLAPVESDSLAEFAAMTRAVEREACARVAREKAVERYKVGDGMGARAADEVNLAILARGK